MKLLLALLLVALFLQSSSASTMLMRRVSDNSTLAGDSGVHAKGKGGDASNSTEVSQGPKLQLPGYLQNLVLKIQKIRNSQPFCDLFQEEFTNQTGIPITCKCTRSPFTLYVDMACTHDQFTCVGGDRTGRYCGRPKYKISFAANPFNTNLEINLAVCTAQLVVIDSPVGNFQFPEICVNLGFCGQIAPVPLASPCKCGGTWGGVTCTTCKLCDPIALPIDIPVVGVELSCKPGLASLCIPIPFPLPVNPPPPEPAGSVQAASIELLTVGYSKDYDGGMGFIPMFNLTDSSNWPRSGN